MRLNVVVLDLLCISGLLLSTVTCQLHEAHFVSFDVQPIKQRVVHLDFKGAPLRPAFLKRTLALIAKLGATAVLLEYEDMFPWQGILASARNGNAYSLEDVNDILKYARWLGLTVIPLVQTIGHLEWLLKTKQFMHLREDSRYPMVLCTGSDEARQVAVELTRQIAAVHAPFGLPYLHVGADEVFQIGICPESAKALNTTWGGNRHRFVFSHLRAIADSLRKDYPATKLLAWHDEFVRASASDVAEFQLADAYEPMVWKYTEDLSHALTFEMWRNLSLSFPFVWGASAYRGATGPSRLLNPILPYLHNNEAWLEQRLRFGPLFRAFRGIVLTGWARYDHFASLCELLPASIPSLALSLKLLEYSSLGPFAMKDINDVLACNSQTTLDDFLRGNASCHFKGQDILHYVTQLQQSINYVTNTSWIANREAGWLRPSHRRLAISEPYYLDSLQRIYTTQFTKIRNIATLLRKSFVQWFYEDAWNEFYVDYIEPTLLEVQARLNASTEIGRKQDLPPRPYF